MSKILDAWEDEWSNEADNPPASQESIETKKPSSKVTKAQKRAQQAEFNRQLWAEAEGPKETNYFLESRNLVPLRTEYRPPPILLSRKGPIIQSSRPPTESLDNLSLKTKQEESSSEDEETKAKNKQTLTERQAQAAREREEKQRKYEERRLELFGPAQPTAVTSASNSVNTANSRSGTSSPNNLTPPGSRSATPSRRGGGSRGGAGSRRGGGNNNNNNLQQSRSQPRDRELFDPSYTPRRDHSTTTSTKSESPAPMQQPIRAPRGPDASGRAGFGFGLRGGR